MSQKGAPEHDGRRGKPYVWRLANEFVERFPDSDLLGLQIMFAINACYNAQRAGIRKTFKDMGLAKTIGRSTILRALLFAGRPLTHNEIASELEVTPGSVTYLVDSLERAGLAERTVDEADRRTVYVALTPSGQEMANSLTPAIAEFATEIGDSFSDDEKEQFRDLLLRHLDASRQKYIDTEPVLGKAGITSRS